MAQQINVTETLNLNPTGYTGLSNLTTSGSYPVSDGYTDASSSTYARFTLSSGSTGHIYYTFDAPDIPSGATINSVSCTAKVRVSSTSRVTNTVCQLYSGSTAKGSSTTFASTSTSNTVSPTAGTWTVSELEDIRLYISGYGSSGGGGGGSSRYIYFYGATVSITYSLSTTQYTITASSLAASATVDPASQTAYAGEEAVVRIDCSDITEYIITDNDNDISSALVQHEIETGGTLSNTAESSTYSGLSNGSSYASYAVGHTAESPYSSVSNMYASSGSTGYVDYQFDFSDMPSNATISSVEVKVYGKRESSTTDSTHIAKIGLYSSNDTLKSTEEEFTSTTAYILTVADPGTWTREELVSAYLRFTVGYYGGAISGITWNVTYTTPNTGNQYYWTYTISNIANDHVILVDELSAVEPPEEDPTYNYWPITISSINATTNPANGTTRVVEGSNQTITISPTDPQLTLALDNGVDITSQLQGGAGSNTYTVTQQVSGADYGFNLDSSTGYYESTNQGVSSSASVCRVNFNLDNDCLITFNYIIYTADSEANYDYCQFGAVDTALSTDNTRDSGVYHDGYGESSSSAQTLTYELTAGSHFIDIKYRKDYSYDEGNDSLQWKIESIEPTSSSDYTYTLTNITAKHSLIFVFGSVNYYYITSSSTGSGDRYMTPDGQMVVLEGDSYKLTIIPNNAGSTVSITDNGTNMTSSLEQVSGTDKNGNAIINYIYRLTDITATHTLIVTVGEATSQIYLKENGSWVAYSKVYKKINGSWVEQADLSSVFSTSTNYVKSS